MRKTPVLIVLLLLVASCGARSRATREGRETIAGTGTVDLGRLTSAETLLLVEVVRTEASPCEGDLSLLETLEKPDPCDRALRALGFIYRHILEGYGKEDVLDQYVARFKNVEPVKLDLEGCPDTGPDDARVTITVFSDFQCPFCRKAAKVLMDLKEQRGDEVRVVFKHFPLTKIHPESMNAALAAAAAHMQGRFWEMHDELFALEVSIDPCTTSSSASRSRSTRRRWRRPRRVPGSTWSAGARISRAPR
jgi:hypothetical protein